MTNLPGPISDGPLLLQDALPTSPHLAVTIADMVDTIGGDALRLLAIIARDPEIKVAGYITGPSWLAWPTEDLGKVTPTRRLLRIDQANAILIFPGVHYLAVDIEPGAASLPDAIKVAEARARIKLRTCFYVFESELNQVRNAVHAAGLDGWADYWLADWNLTRGQAIRLLGGPIKAVQYASPSRGGSTLIPGTGWTLAAANADLSVTLSDWPVAPAPLPPAPKPAPKPKPPHKPLPPVHPKVKGATIGAALTAAIVALTKTVGIHLTSYEISAIGTVLAGSGGWITPSKPGG